MTTFPGTGLIVPEAGAPGQTSLVVQLMYLLDAGFPNAVVISRTIGTPPGSPLDGDLYVIPSSGTTGAWVGHEDELTIYLNGWIYLVPKSMWSVRVGDDDLFELEWTGSAWVERGSWGSVAGGIAASTTQTQGQGQIVDVTNQVLTVANPNDVVTLPTALIGLPCIVANDGANTLQIFPASGDEIDGGGVNNSTTLAAGKRAIFACYAETKWMKIAGA
jgi:hypothetical protein